MTFNIAKGLVLLELQLLAKSAVISLFNGLQEKIVTMEMVSNMMVVIACVELNLDGTALVDVIHDLVMV